MTTHRPLRAVNRRTRMLRTTKTKWKKRKTNATTINMGSVATAGYAYMRNVSTANYIEIGTGTGTSFVAFSKLSYGEAQVVRLGTNAPTAKANTAAGTLQYTILSA